MLHTMPFKLPETDTTLSGEIFCKLQFFIFLGGVFWGGYMRGGGAYKIIVELLQTLRRHY